MRFTGLWCCSFHFFPFISFPVAKICVVSRTEEVLPAEFCKGFEISDIITQSTVLQDLPEALTPQQLLKHTGTILPLVLAGQIEKLKSL